MAEIGINCLIGQVLDSIVVNDDNDEIIFNTSTEKQYKMYHAQDCCESVRIEDICGDLNDLIGEPITLAEEVSNANEGDPPSEFSDSWTWTFYKFATNKGYVTIRWLGQSNGGYYSESVSFVEMR